MSIYNDLDEFSTSSTLVSANYINTLLQLQSSPFNWTIMVAIFLNAITIAMETTPLQETHPLFFEVTDGIFLAIYIAEFLIKVYAGPISYWKNYYNLFDFTILVVSLVQTILSVLEIGHTGIVLLKVIRGNSH